MADRKLTRKSSNVLHRPNCQAIDSGSQTVTVEPGALCPSNWSPKHGTHGGERKNRLKMYKYSSPGEENNSLINNEHKMKAHVLKSAEARAGRGILRGGNKKDAAAAAVYIPTVEGKIIAQLKPLEVSGGLLIILFWI